MRKEIESYFVNIVGSPVWNAKKGVGTFLTLEFGKPSIRTIEPNSRRTYRKVVLYGEFHLWICDCQWEIFDDYSKISDDKSENSIIENSLGFLNGQILVSVEYFEGNTRFYFDLGAVLVTCPIEIEDSLDQWILYRDEQVILALTKDGELNTGS